MGHYSDNVAAWLMTLSFAWHFPPSTIKLRQHSRQLSLNFTTAYLFSKDWNDYVYSFIVYEKALISFCSEQKKNLWIINKIFVFPVLPSPFLLFIYPSYSLPQVTFEPLCSKVMFSAHDKHYDPLPSRADTQKFAL